MTVGIYAVDKADKEKAQMRKRIEEISKQHEGVVNCHGVFIDTADKWVTFDVTMDFSISDKQALTDRIKKEAEQEFPGYCMIVNGDTDYSD